MKIKINNLKIGLGLLFFVSLVCFSHWTVSVYYFSFFSITRPRDPYYATKVNKTGDYYNKNQYEIPSKHGKENEKNQSVLH